MGGCAIGENPLPMDRIFFERLDCRQGIGGQSFLSSLGQGVGCAFEGWDIFRSGGFQAGDFDNKSLQRTRTSRADERSVARDPVARNRGADFVERNRGADFVERLVTSHYVRRNKALDLTPRGSASFAWMPVQGMRSFSSGWLLWGSRNGKKKAEKCRKQS